ncbi:MAG: lipoate protein ligase C-terminal domain-containing protein [Thermoplasmata archaeon]
MRKKVIVEDPAGKFLKITMDFNGEIKEVVITGDFFAHPEEAIDELQETLKGVKAEGKEIRRVLEKFFSREGMHLYGISLEGLMIAFLECLEE